MSEQDWSVPETVVLNGMRAVLEAGREAVLATVVDVEGNAYRRPGAKMLIEADGGGLGAITAGCLEEEVLDIADEVLDAGRPRVETYDLMEDEEDVWGLGVGCNGIIDILLEPVDATYRPALEAVADEDPIGVLTVLRSEAPGVEPGARAYYRPGSGVAPETEDFPAEVADRLADAAASLVADGGADTVEFTVDGAAVSVFIDAIRPRPELLVCGSGHDVGPVVELAKRNDFRVTVAGFRGAADLEARFPEADRTVATAPARLVETVAPDERTYAVIMTHNFVDDRLALEALLETPVPYIGLMGPRERFEEMREDFAAEGRTIEPADRERLHTPIGLNLGGGSPYQIATSIVAEVLAVANDREPVHLRDREGPIHDRAEVEVPDT